MTDINKVENILQRLKHKPWQTTLYLLLAVVAIAMLAYINGCFTEKGKLDASSRKKSETNPVAPIINQQIVNISNDNQHKSNDLEQQKEQVAKIEQMLAELKPALNEVRNAEVRIKQQVSELETARSLPAEQARSEIRRISQDIQDSPQWLLDFFSTNREMRKIEIEKSLWQIEEEKQANLLIKEANVLASKRAVDEFILIMGMMLDKYKAESPNNLQYILPITPTSGTNYPISFSIDFDTNRQWNVNITYVTQNDKTTATDIRIEFRPQTYLSLYLAPIQGVCEVMVGGEMSVKYFKRKYPIDNASVAIKDVLRSLFDNELLLGRQY